MVPIIWECRRSHFQTKHSSLLPVYPFFTVCMFRVCPFSAPSVPPPPHVFLLFVCAEERALPEFALKPQIWTRVSRRPSWRKVKIIWNDQLTFRNPWRSGASRLVFLQRLRTSSHDRGFLDVGGRVGGVSTHPLTQEPLWSSVLSRDGTLAIFQCVPPFLLEDSRAHGTGAEHGCCGDVFLMWHYCEQLQR